MFAVSTSQCAGSRALTPLHRTRPCACRMRHQQRHALQRVQAVGGPGSAPNLNDGNGRNAQSVIKDSDVAFVGKLVALSVIGGFVIKYGSLLISLPFEPSAAAALSVVLGTPTLYSLYLLLQSSKPQ